jgi:hypothetical protein
MQLNEVFQSDRREQATDARGVPASYARALKALEGSCAHCSQRAVIANGGGVGLCRAHRQMRVDGIAERERLQRKLEMMRRNG